MDAVTTRPTVSRAQLDALEATAESKLSRADGPYPHWYIDDGLAVTASALALLGRGLIEEGHVRDDGRIPAVLTEAGRELLDELASRAPSAWAEGSDRG